MKKLTKQEQKDEAWKAYEATTKPTREASEAVDDAALEVYLAKIDAIDAQPWEGESIKNGLLQNLIIIGIDENAVFDLAGKVSTNNLRYYEADEVPKIITVKGKKYKLVEE